MRETTGAGGNTLSLAEEQRINEVCNRFELAWKAQEEPRIDDYLGDWAEPERSALLRELLAVADQLAGQATEPASKVGPERDTPPRTSGEERGARDESGASLLATRHSPLATRDYELLGVLGKGGMGLVYRARQRSANRIVALKVIRQDQLQNRSPDQRLPDAFIIIHR